MAFSFLAPARGGGGPAWDPWRAGVARRRLS